MNPHLRYGCLCSPWRGRRAITLVSLTALLFAVVPVPVLLAQAAGPDVAIATTSLMEVADPGDSVTFDLIYNNNGPVDATSVVIVETVPANTTAGTNPGWELAPAGSGVACDGAAAGTECVMAVGTLVPAAFGTASFEAIVDPLVEDVEFVESAARIEHDAVADGADPVPPNNTSIFAVAIFEPPIPPAALGTLAVPTPNLSDFLKTNGGAEWGIALGKALFWDMQLGSDGYQACASCHFNAGADSRSFNQLNPGSPSLGGTTFEFGGPNFQLIPGDFPFHKLSDINDRNSTILRSNDEIVSSQGVINKTFVKARNNPVDKGITEPDAVFGIGGVNTRRVEPRNTPSVINAVFNFRNFWDGRAQNEFNGVNPFGSRDPNAKVLRRIDDLNVEEVSVSIKDASLASQAVGPPTSSFEMSWDGRTWPDIGKKMVRLNRPLQMQMVDPSDSVLGGYSSAPAAGIDVKYRQLIRRTFKSKWWKSDLIIRVTPNGLEYEPKPPDFKLGHLADNEYTLMMYNFSLFFGLAIQMYEQTLIAGDTPVDRFLAGDQSALTQQEIEGFALFSDKGRCVNCHGGPAFTNAESSHVKNQRLERMVMGNNQVAVYDNGFYNIGVRPTPEDIGLGGTDPFGLPLSMTGLAQLGLLNNANIEIDPNERIAVNGAFKTSQLRNVALTAPYFHNGGHSTLRQVVEFYNRGADFNSANQDDLDPDIRNLGLAELEIDALVAFLLALTDERVENRQAPFDHPQLFIPYGHPEDGNGNLIPRFDDPLAAEDFFLEIPATGAAGGPPLDRFLGIVETP